MSQALVLAPPVAVSVSPTESGELPIQSAASRARYLFGDSTPFPVDRDFIATISDAVDCAVSLLVAHDAITRAVDQASSADRRCDAERARLDALASDVARCAGAAQVTTAERVVRVASRVLETARATINAELAQVEKARSVESARAAATLSRAQKDAAAALEKFLGKHDLPGGEVALRLSLREGEYRAEALVVAPFGVSAVFELAMPERHAFRRTRRVGDLGDGVTISAPQPSGFFGRKVKVLPLKLDRWFIRSIALSAERSILTLGRNAAIGSGMRLEMARDVSGVMLRGLGEDGEPKGGVHTLDASDSASVRALFARVVAATYDLTTRRRSLKSAFADDRPLSEHAAPEMIARRLVQSIAPIVDEIARRSGAPGELVLRRDVRAWRREEIYLTKGELYERIRNLPAPLRSAFDVLDLEGARESSAPRAFRPRAGSVIDVTDADIVD